MLLDNLAELPRKYCSPVLVQHLKTQCCFWREDSESHFYPSGSLLPLVLLKVLLHCDKYMSELPICLAQMWAGTKEKMFCNCLQNDHQFLTIQSDTWNVDYSAFPTRLPVSIGKVLLRAALCFYVLIYSICEKKSHIYIHTFLYITYIKIRYISHTYTHIYIYIVNICVCILSFFVTAMTGLEQPGMNWYQNPFVNVLWRLKSLSRAIWSTKQRQQGCGGYPDLAFTITPIAIWVYAGPNFLQKGTASRCDFKVSYVTEQTRKQVL